jgi:hypothetical protein
MALIREDFATASALPPRTITRWGAEPLPLCAGLGLG